MPCIIKLIFNRKDYSYGKRPNQTELPIDPQDVRISGPAGSVVKGDTLIDGFGYADQGVIDGHSNKPETS
jgi:hypothetical protein